MLLLLQELRDDFQDWDKDVYLPPDLLDAKETPTDRAQLDRHGNLLIPIAFALGEVRQPLRVAYFKQRYAFLHDQLDKYSVLRLRMPVH
jgi:hypothetical protein